MIGGEHSFASGGWSETRVGPMLPVELLPGGLDWTPGESVRLQAELPATPHPIWTLMADAKQNRQIVGSLPAVSGLNRWVGARTNLTTVLATAAVSSTPTTNAAGDGAFLVAGAQSAGSVPAVVVGRYGRGRTAAMAFAITAPYADELVQRWGLGDNRYYAKFCRNLIYWLTENSAIGRRRLVASADKRFYRPGETIAISAATYDESASPTKNYRVVAMVEPHTTAGEAEPETSPLRWPGVNALAIKRRLPVQRFRGHDDRLGDLHQLLVFVAGEFLQAAKGFRLVHAQVLHQQPLGPFDHLAVGQRLPQVGRLLPQRLILFVTPQGQADRRFELRLRGRLDQIAQHVVLLRPVDQLRVAEAGQQNHRRRRTFMNHHRRVQAIHVGHIDVGENHVGPLLQAIVDQLSARRTGEDHVVAQRLQYLGQSSADFLVVVRDGHAQAIRSHFGLHNRTASSRYHPAAH